MGRPRTAAVNGDSHRPAWSVETERAWRESGKNQTEYGKVLGVSQQAVSAWINARKEPELENIRSLVTRGGARVEPFRELLAIFKEGGPLDDYTTTRRTFFLRFLAKLQELYAAFGASMDADDLAWRAHTLFTRAILLDFPESLPERLEFILQQERQRLKRGDNPG